MNKTLSKAMICAAVAGTLGWGAMAMAADNVSTTADYVATFQPMNANVTGSEASGKAWFEIKGDDMVIHVRMKGVPANITHWQHFHGFKSGADATCPTAASDANGDGIVDLIETHPTSGKTMVPFDKAPAAMDVAHGSYPKADADGTYHYRQSVSLKALQAAFGKAFDGHKLDLDKRVIFIHGVPASTDLPASVASLRPIPASVTLPIACAVIEPAD